MDILQELLRQRALLQRMQELNEAMAKRCCEEMIYPMTDSDVMKRLCRLIAEIDF